MLSIALPLRPRRPPPKPRRAEMYRKVAQLFRDRGFDATPVSDVARALGLTKAGLYHHFESKETLLFEIMMFGLDKVRDEVLIPVAPIRDPEERLRELIVRHAKIITRGKGAVAHLGDEIRALPASPRRQIERRMRVYVKLLRRTFEELRAAGRLGPVDPQRGGVRRDRHDLVAAAVVPAGRTTVAGRGRADDRGHRARRPDRPPSDAPIKQKGPPPKEAALTDD